MSIEDSMIRYYADRAREYERIYHKPERQEDLRRLRAFVERTFAGLNVFEVACGTGYWTEVLASSAASVLATDINEATLEIARSKNIEPGKAEFQLLDAYNLASVPRRFNGGLAAFWWSHIPLRRLREFLEGFHRVFVPGARLIFFDNLFVEGSSTPISRSDSDGDSYQMRTLDDGSQHEVVKNFPTAGELRSTVDGLADDVRVEMLQYDWILTYNPRIEPI